MPNEICILCGLETTVDMNTHVDFRTGYIEGAGQCYVPHVILKETQVVGK